MALSSSSPHRRQSHPRASHRHSWDSLPLSTREPRARAARQKKKERDQATTQDSSPVSHRRRTSSSNRPSRKPYGGQAVEQRKKKQRGRALPWISARVRRSLLPTTPVPLALPFGLAHGPLEFSLSSIRISLLSSLSTLLALSLRCPPAAERRRPAASIAASRPTPDAPRRPLYVFCLLVFASLVLLPSTLRVFWARRPTRFTRGPAHVKRLWPSRCFLCFLCPLFISHSSFTSPWTLPSFPTLLSPSPSSPLIPISFAKTVCLLVL